MDELSKPQFNIFTQWADPIQSELAHRIQSAESFAAKLAFTDWDTSLRLMSVPALSYLMRQAYATAT